MILWLSFVDKRKMFSSHGTLARSSLTPTIGSGLEPVAIFRLHSRWGVGGTSHPYVYPNVSIGGEGPITLPACPFWECFLASAGWLGKSAETADF
jgi:hypothetical protein